ncbi:MAG TPA: SDR family oxidoreductase [Nitrososphaeraceae archaeon]|jgi:glucose 1-dehydrogenase|nr:SDR family oxidoreductase [Nitrososphaeraceae archaeon]
MSNNNQKRVVVITGSSRGIGKAIAKEFAKNNYSVLLNARDEKELIETVREIKNEISDPSQVAYLTGDISEEKICISLIEEAINKFGRINVLVNNAGISGPSQRTNNITSKDWDYVIGVNLRGTFLCTREALKYMTRGSNNNNNNNNIDRVKGNNKDFDYDLNFSIINISSVHESIPMPYSAPYSASKGGMEMLTKNIALEVAEKGIRINGIAPGAINTPMNKDIMEDPQKKKQEEEKIPMRRIGEPEEIAKVAFFLASTDASYITGTTVYVDGGLTLSQ